MIRRTFLGFACAAAALAPLGAMAASPITIGFPIPLSGPASVYGVPILKGAELAVAHINKNGGVLGRKLKLMPRDTAASADRAVRVARELIIKDNVNFLAGVLSSAAALAVTTVAKENQTILITGVAKDVKLTRPPLLHPYIFRVSENTWNGGAAGAYVMAKTANWKGIKTVATIGPDYAYGRDTVESFVTHIKMRRPDIKIVDQEWPKLGATNFTPFITAQMSKHPDAVYCAEYGGDFVTFVKQAGPLGYFKAIHNRLVDPAEVGTIDEAVALGSHYPYGIWSEAYDPAIWTGTVTPALPASHKAFQAALRAEMKSKYGSGWAIQGYQAIVALAAGIKKAGSTNNLKVSKALLGLTYETPVGPRTINPKTHETDTGEFWGEMVTVPSHGSLALMKNPTYLPPSVVLK